MLESSILGIKPQPSFNFILVTNLGHKIDSYAMRTRPWTVAADIEEQYQHSALSCL